MEKSGYLVRHIYISAWNTSAPNIRIFMKSDISGLFHKFVKNSRLIQICQKIIGTST
jgi:hypothetical protein